MFDTAAADPLAGMLVYAVGAVAKAVTSEQERKLEHRNEAKQLSYGWTLREIPLPQQTTRATLQPGLAYP
jgi:hypothetical protein